MAIGAKKIETRSWRTDYRGLVAIHAAKAMPMGAAALCFEDPFLSALRGMHAPKELPRGAVIAIVRLIGCRRTEDIEPQIMGTPEWTFGDYSAGRWAWFFEHRPDDALQPLGPIPAKGMLGLWEWADPRVGRAQA